MVAKIAAHSKLRSGVISKIAACSRDEKV